MISVCKAFRGCA